MRKVIEMMFGRARSRLARIGALIIVGCLAGCLLAACGGSGSSGFDGEPASEPQAIAEAVDQQTCIEFEAVTYCGSGAPFEGAAAEGSVEIDEPLTPVACAEIPGQDACVAEVEFRPAGFPPGTAFVVASSATVEGPWDVSSQLPPPSSGGAGPEDREAEVELPSAGGTEPPPSPLIVAVLVYFSGVAPGAPEQIDALADLEPDVAYVSRELDVVTSPP
jgi:hypothetical protein